MKITAAGIKFNDQNELVVNTPETLFSISAGAGAQDGVPVYPVLKMGDAESVSAPLAFLPMKRRTIRVALHIVSSAAPGRADIAPRLLPADAQQTKTELTDYLNDIYPPQINAHFDITPIEESIALDTDDETDFPGPIPPSSGDGELQMGIIGSGESELVIANRTGDFDIHVFVVGGISRIRQYISYTPFPNQLWVTKGIYFGIAATSPGEDYCLIDGHRTGANQNQATKEEVFHTIAHEIGHILFGSGHPDEKESLGKGVAPLPESKHVERLMCSGPNKTLDSKLIVKAELDQGLIWLKNRDNDD